MRILALETIAFTGTLALLEDDQVIAERSLPEEQRSAQSLAPAIEALLSDATWDIGSLGLIAVAEGPGSFTGLRVGITTAKGLAYAIQAEVLSIDTLEVIAAQATEASPGAMIYPVLDAQRNQLFAASFLRETAGGFPIRRSATHIADLAPWLAELPSGGVVIGPVVGKIQGKLPSDVIIADETAWHPRAATVGRLAWRDYQGGRRDSLWKLIPQYHRASAAEEKAAEKK
jgi:tRNA threonylcarbamoyladenosine biosynthesis protein TsaB